MIKFRLGRVKAGISIWFAAYFCFLFLMPDNAFLLSAMMAMAIHEAGHFLMMGLFGVPVRGFFLLLGRLVIVPAAGNIEQRREVPVLLGGVLFNLIFSIAFACFGCPLASQSNLIVAVYNMLPAGDLDGGALAMLFLNTKYPPRKAYTAHLILSFSVSFALLVTGFLLMLRAKKDTTVFLCGLYITAQCVANLSEGRRV